jgi:type IV secretory pathway VirB4 component
LQAVYPFVGSVGLPGPGPLIGRDLLGGAFCFDPWELYQRGLLTNPNLLVVGQVGRGKSTFVKTFVWRQLALGRQAWIVDPKGEYGSLALAGGGRPLRLAPGGSVRLNPLDVDAGWRHREAGAVIRQQVQLINSLASSSLARPLSPAEHTAIEIAVRAAGGTDAEPTLRHVIRALLEPEPDMAATVGTDAAGLAADGRSAALQLRRLVHGDLAGMFDGPTSTDVRFDAPLVVLDLSAVFTSPALAMIMTCASAALQSILRDADGGKRLLIVDEAWAVLHDLATARWLQSTFKLSRAIGIANVAVVHRLSDLEAAGHEGSAQQRLAEGLLADTETRVVFGQPASEADTTGEMLRLTGVERDLVAKLPRGVALWKVANRSFLVEHLLRPGEHHLVDTDAAMGDGALRR